MDKIFQVALLQSLVQGYYDGAVKIGDLGRHGDTGIGTFDGVDGEMIMTGGKAYKALFDGRVCEADADDTSPFCAVTFFEKDFSARLTETDSAADLFEKLTEKVGENGKNLFYTVKISGTFDKMTVRSIPKQKKPYRSLDIVQQTDQRVFTYENVTGTAVALYCPDYAGGINMPGWHAHFISDDRKKGGHILELSFSRAEADFCAARGFELFLPDGAEFQRMELSRDLFAEIRKVETDG